MPIMMFHFSSSDTKSEEEFYSFLMKRFSILKYSSPEKRWDFEDIEEYYSNTLLFASSEKLEIMARFFIEDLPFNLFDLETGYPILEFKIGLPIVGISISQIQGVSDADAIGENALNFLNRNKDLIGTV